MRCLFVVIPEPGHMNPMLAIAQHLVRDGHEVRWFTTFAVEGFADRLAGAGLATSYDAPPPRPVERRSSDRDLLRTLLNRPTLARRWYAHGLIGSVGTQLPTLRTVVRTYKPDVIAIDPFVWTGAIVAEQEHIPWAAISTQLLAVAPDDFHCPYFDYLEDAELAATRERLLNAEGVRIRFALGEAISPSLNTVFTTDSFAAPNARRSDVVLVGPAVPIGVRDDLPFPWDRLRGDPPLVYVSFGSQLAAPANVYAALGSALSADEADVVLALGNMPCPPDLPPHIIAVPWAPQLALLDRAAVMVSHGGAGSVAECLSRGRPMVIIPLGHDQPLQGCLVERAGVGRTFAPEDLTVERLATALRQLLAGPERERATEIGRELCAANGAANTAERLTRLVDST